MIVSGPGRSCCDKVTVLLRGEPKTENSKSETKLESPNGEITETRPCFGHFSLFEPLDIVSRFVLRDSSFPFTAFRGRRLQQVRCRCRCSVRQAARCKVPAAT